MKILKTLFIGIFFGTIGTLLGGLIGTSMKNVSNKVLSFILAIAAGIMTSVITLDLITEAYIKSNIIITIEGIVLGIFTMLLCDILIQRKLIKYKSSISTLLKTGIVISIGLALHNIPEGLAIGTSFESSVKLGFSLAITIAIHDIPEGISMAVPMKKSGISTSKVLLYVFLSGITTGIGALIGSVAITMSSKIIPLSLSFAAGSMLYIVSAELTPEYTKLYNEKLSSFGNILGFILGFIATKI